MTELKRLDISRRMILDTINNVETVMGAMFHTFQPDVDKAIHTVIWNDSKKLDIFRRSLIRTYLDNTGGN